MKRFAELVGTLGTGSKTNAKLDALVHYFENAEDRDKIWVIAIFSGRKPKRVVSSSFLMSICIELTGYPDWLFEECYHTVGDLGETLSLLVPEGKAETSGLPLHYYLEKLIELAGAGDDEKKNFIIESWNGMSRNEMFVFNKLITGNFRIGVSQKMIVNALAKTSNNSPSVIAHRISGNWDPQTFPYSELMGAESALLDHSRPYPFYLAYALEDELQSLGEPSEWFAEWKWDGIRGEIIRRDQQIFVWSRGEELMTDKFPEYQPLQELLPEGTVLDGEIICLLPSGENPIGFIPLPFAMLQTRIGRKNITRKQLTEAPVGFIAYDLLEFEGEDFREHPQWERREILERIVAKADLPLLQISPLIPFNHWDELSVDASKSQGNRQRGSHAEKKTGYLSNGSQKGRLVEMEN